MTVLEPTAAAFAGYVDLASERLGGKALLANDEFFAEKENLLKAGRGIFIADKYTDRGKWMDGWESRRKRVPGYDWCAIKLGLAGRIHGVDIDTNHFLGNHPPFASVDGCIIDDEDANEKLLGMPVGAPGSPWHELLSKSPLERGAQNLFSIANEERWTHVRLNIYPDGGVARFRVYGEVRPGWHKVQDDQLIDLAGITNGGTVTACSDMFFGNKNNLIMPDRGINMGDGWETKRRRGPGFDWAIIKLACTGMLKEIEVDTAHFKGNFPDRCSLEGCLQPGADIDILNAHNFEWTPILEESKLKADTRHHFSKEILKAGPWSHVRFNIFPDGGVSRLRLLGTAMRDQK